MTERDQTRRTAESRLKRRLSIVLAAVPVTLALVWGAGPAAAATSPTLAPFGGPGYTNGARTLNWTDSDPGDIDFHVFRGGAGCAGAVDITPGGLGLGATTYTDSSTPADGTLCYFVRSVDATMATADSNQMSIVYDTTPPTAPTASATSPTNAPPLIKWTASTDAGSGLDHYEVWRNDGSGYNQIATLAPGTLAFTDNGVGANTSPSYEVRAVDKLNQASTSNAVSGGLRHDGAIDTVDHDAQLDADDDGVPAGPRLDGLLRLGGRRPRPLSRHSQRVDGDERRMREPDLHRVHRYGLRDLRGRHVHLRGSRR